MIPASPFVLRVISINVVSINRYKARDIIHLKNIFILPDNIAKINPIFKECEPGPDE